MKIKTDLTIVDNNAKYVCQRKIKVKPILKNVLKYYAEFPNDKRRHTDIEASCPICLAAGVRVNLADGAREFKCCPICGINLDWRIYFKKRKKILCRMIEQFKRQKDSK